MDQIREKTADMPGILVEVTAPRGGPPTGKPVQVQLSALNPDAAAGRSAKKVAAMLVPDAAISAISTTACRCRASTGRSQVDKAEAAKYGAGAERRRQRRPARHQRHEGHRVSPVRDATRRSISWCASRPTGAASTRSTICACRPPSGHVPIGNFVAARAGAARRLHQSRRRQPRHDGVGQLRRGRAERHGADRRSPAELRQDRSRPGVTFASRARTKSAPRPAPS